jgi:hypothetical protein
MASIRSFAAPHKALRNVLSKFSFDLGCADFQNHSELTQLKVLGREMFTLLNNHAHSENEYTLRHLEERVKGASTHDRQDHEQLEVIQDKLEQQLNGFTGGESSDEIHLFYLDVSHFHSQYLEHIHEEETVTELLLQQHFTDDELMTHRMEIMKSIDFPVLLLWMKYVIPAQPESESLLMLQGLKASAPPGAFEEVLAVIKNEMTPRRYDGLISKMANLS